MDNGFNRSHGHPPGGDPPDHRPGPIGAPIARHRLVASNDNRPPLKLRLQRLALLAIVIGVIGWLVYAALR